MKNEKTGKAIASVKRQVTYSGPLPAPKTLQEYDKIVPGAAERIIAMAETQAKHRQEIEKAFIKSRTRDSFLGVIFGGVIGISAIIAAVLIAINSNPWAGSLFGAGGITGLVSVFIYGTKSSKSERDKKEGK